MAFNSEQESQRLSKLGQCWKQQSVLELDRAEEKEAKKKKQKQKTKEIEKNQKCDSPQTKPATSSSWIPMTPVSHDYDTKTCECYQYEVTGDCWCEMW